MRDDRYVLAGMVVKDLGEKLDCYTEYYVAPGKWSRERRDAHEFRTRAEAERARAAEQRGAVLVAEYHGGWRKRWLTFAKRQLARLQNKPAPITGLN